MDPFGGPPHSFPRSNGGPEARHNRPHPRRGARRRLPRPPAWVRAPLVTFQHPSITTTTTRSSHVRHLFPGTLQPITRFCSPRDIRSPTEVQPTLVLMDNGSSRDILLLLRGVSSNVREKVFWSICRHVLEFFKQQPLPLQSPWIKIFLPRQYPGPQTELVEYNPANRYQQEYEEEEELGRGGFGRVVRARNKLDGRYYAVKMIITDDMGELSLEACVPEVIALAELEHPRVVRYYTAWVQQDVWSQHQQRGSATVRELNSDSSGDYSEESSSDNSVSAHIPPTGQGVFQDVGTGEVEAQLPSPSAHRRQTQGHRHSQNSGRANGLLLSYMPRLVPRPKKILYIQMRLYGKSLRMWMDDRNSSHSPVVVERECLRIFRQVLEAMCYIHQQGYMHRDIKPANILFTLEGSDVQLGDFGLARLIAHPPSASSHTNLTSDNYTRNVGTPLYTAPEVKHGNYGKKSDMYSLGIILLELFMPLKTDFERSIVISRDLKEKGDLDPDLMLNWPSIAYWIKKLADKDPDNRPSAKELLESSLFPQPEPPPSPTTTTGDTVAGGFPMQALTLTPHVMEAAATTVEFTRSEFTSSIEINQINAVESVNNCTVRIEERLSKDEQIALLKEEIDALRRKVEALERVEREREMEALKREREVEALKHDLNRCKIGNATQADEY